MPRTAPDLVSSASTYRTLSISMIDTSGDVLTETFRIGAGETNNDIEAFVDAYVPLTNALLFKIEISTVWRGDDDVSLAIAGNRSSVKAGINAGFRDPAFLSETLRIVAPVPSLFVPNTDNVDTSLVTIGTLANTFTAISASMTELVSLGYTERRETNKKTRV